MTPAMYINVATIVLSALIWTGLMAYLRIKKRKNLTYLLLFTIFYVYLYKVLDYTLFQFQSLLLLKHFIPNVMLRGQAAEEAVNLIPLVTLTSQDVKTSLLNVLLFVPFGFGLPFLTHFSMKKVIGIGALVSVTIELVQLLTGLAARMTFRVADVNDVIFNTLGVVIGYAIFVVVHLWHENKTRGSHRH